MNTPIQNIRHRYQQKIMILIEGALKEPLGQEWHKINDELKNLLTLNYCELLDLSLGLCQKKEK